MKEQHREELDLTIRAMDLLRRLGLRPSPRSEIITRAQRAAELQGHDRVLEEDVRLAWRECQVLELDATS